jgi:hypothetical protein
MNEQGRNSWQMSNHKSTYTAYALNFKIWW